MEKKEDEKTEQDVPPLYFINIKLVVPGCNETVAIQVSSFYVCKCTVIKNNFVLLVELKNLDHKDIPNLLFYGFSV